MKLFYFPGACSLADHIVLEWIGDPYETVKMDHDSIRSPEYLALNSSGAVPLLIDDDFALTQNAAILSYLADLNPDARLLGDGSVRGRAEVMRWLAFLNSDLHPAFKPIFAPARFLADRALANTIAATARINVREHLEILNAQLEGREWLTNARSIADPYLFVMLRWAIRLQVDLAGFGNLLRFMERMYSDPAVRAVLIAEEGEIIDYTNKARSELMATA